MKKTFYNGSFFESFMKTALFWTAFSCVEDPALILEKCWSKKTFILAYFTQCHEQLFLWTIVGDITRETTHIHF